jgi:CheY-like chemotaxis protein/HPt (histidine-containing phosphotransfer) domain-containing protein
MVAKAFDEKRPYDIIFMDHMMPGMDGIETTGRIRELEKSRPNENGEVPKIPVICLSANAVQGAKEFFLSSGMDGFISKPIESAALNETLRKFLPSEKYTLVNAKDGKSASGELTAREKQLFKELVKIKGLDILRGLHYAAENFETYISTLKQFSAGMEKGLAVIRESLTAGDWQPYIVQVHAYKGVCATIGADDLSEWGKKLEWASKSGDRSVCLAETGDFCSALEELNAALRGTSLFAETSEEEKIETGAADMAAKLAEFAELCEEGRSAGVKKAVRELEGIRLTGASPEFEAALAEILDLARSMDYDEALGKARELYLTLKIELK